MILGMSQVASIAVAGLAEQSARVVRRFLFYMVISLSLMPRKAANLAMPAVLLVMSRLSCAERKRSRPLLHQPARYILGQRESASAPLDFEQRYGDHAPRHGLLERICRPVAQDRQQIARSQQDAVPADEIVFKFRRELVSLCHASSIEVSLCWGSSDDKSRSAV